MMKPSIHMTKVWFDDDMVELKIDVSDGTSVFSTKVYVGYDPLAQAVTNLDVFKTHVHGGLLDLRFGEFGPEWASGAFHARFHFAKPGRLFITCKLQSEFLDFGKKNVASESTLFLQTEPALLDNFIAELKSLDAKRSDEAHLEAI
jgi:hypothetical protein